MDIFANEYTKNLTSIYFISDFQNGSYKIGLLRSHWMQDYPHAPFIDITHDIKLNNTIEAAFVAKQIDITSKEKQIVLIKVGYTKDSICYVENNILYILPNNGLLSMIKDNPDVNNTYIIHEDSEKDAVQLFLNDQISSLQKAGNLLQFRYLRHPNFNTNLIVADCIFIDKHGNCFFNLTAQQFMTQVGNRGFQIKIQHYPGETFKHIGQSITDATPGEAIFRFSKSGYLKLQINLGNAQRLFRIKEETKVIIDIL